MNKSIQNVVKRVNKRTLANNTQRTLLAMLTATTEWVPRTSLRIPSVGARLRDLRKPQFGGFKVLCSTSPKGEVKTRKNVSNRETFYRLDPATITLSRVNKVFEGVITKDIK